VSSSKTRKGIEWVSRIKKLFINSMNEYSQSVNELFNAQLRDWDLAKLNYGLLSKVITREIDFGKFKILVQFNPERMRSSVAKVDAKSIEERPCFLCGKNRPSEQIGVSFEKNLTILINPFPIFTKHLTIPSELHTDQLIITHFTEMLNLAKAIPDFVIFYNGPQCGASAPDHFHFQAGNRVFLPIETDFLDGNCTKFLSENSGVEIWSWSDYMRGIVTLKGSDREKLFRVFAHFFSNFSTIQPDRPEPMLNILAYFENHDWIVHLIPRKLHRPTQFFKEGSEQILFSPASVDLGGVIITPREEDFIKISASDITDIFNQVCLSESEIALLF
jgi:hypothetical protein